MDLWIIKMLMDLGFCFSSGSEARRASMDSGFAVAYLRPQSAPLCLNRLCFSPSALPARCFLVTSPRPLLRPPALLLGFSLPYLVQLADTTPLSFGGRVANAVRKQSIAFVGCCLKHIHSAFCYLSQSRRDKAVGVRNGHTLGYVWVMFHSAGVTRDLSLVGMSWSNRCLRFLILPKVRVTSWFLQDD